MRVIDMFVNKDEEESGIFAVSVVDHPAIESFPVALKKQEVTVKLAEVDPKKQILMGALLIPDKEIPRVDKDGNVYAIRFSKETLTEIIKLYMQKGKQNNTTLEHQVDLHGNTIVEIWQKEDMEKDKSAIYGLSDPIGSIMISMFISDKEKYNEYVRSGKGFSLEGNFTSKLSLKRVDTKTEDDVLMERIKKLIAENGWKRVQKVLFSVYIV